MKRHIVNKIALLVLATIFTASSCDNQEIKSKNFTEEKRREIQENMSSKCDPNYYDCVPIASDVDCAGGSGNGPAYVTGPLKVIGTDIYGLDRNHDGIACE